MNRIATALLLHLETFSDWWQHLGFVIIGGSGMRLCDVTAMGDDIDMKSVHGTARELSLR